MNIELGRLTNKEEEQKRLAAKCDAARQLYNGAKIALDREQQENSNETK